MHVVGGDELHPVAVRKIVEQGEAARIVPSIKHGGREVAAVGEQRREPLQSVEKDGLLRPARRQHDRQQTVGMLGEVIEADVALAFPGAPVAQGQQAGQSLVGLEIGRIDEQRVTVARFETAADE